MVGEGDSRIIDSFLIGAVLCVAFSVFAPGALAVDEAAPLIAPPLPSHPQPLSFYPVLGAPAEDWTQARWVLRELTFPARLSGADDLLPDREAALLWRAQALLENGAVREGESELASLAALATEARIRREARLLLGRSFLERGLPANAVGVLEETLPLYPLADERWRVRFWYATALARSGEVAAAAEAYERAAAEAPKRSRARATALRLAGWQYREASQDAAARNAWQAALSTASGFPSLQDTVRLDLAEVSFAEEQWPDVIRLLDEEYVQPIHSARSGFLLGRAYLNRGEIDSARTVLGRFLRQWPEAQPAWRDEANMILGWIALRGKETGQALVHYQSIDRDRRQEIPQTIYGSALALMGDRRFEEALFLLEPKPPVGSGDLLYYPWVYAQAYARFHLEDYLGAITDLEEFRGQIRSDSLHRAAWSLRGDCFYRLGKSEEAYAAYVKAASVLPDVPELLMRRQALAAVAAEHWGAAARILGDLIVRYPATENGKEYNFWRAEAFYRLGRLEMARRHYVRAAQQGADPLRCAYALGWCEYLEGNWEDALGHFDRAKRGCQNCAFAADLNLRRGNCLFNIGRVEEAEAAFADAMALAAAQQETLLVAESSFRRAWTLLRTDNLAAAAEAFADIRVREGHSPRAAEALYWEGQAFFRQESYRAAAERLRALLEHPGAGDSLKAHALLAIGDSHFNQDQPGEALEWYRRILEAPGADRTLRRTAHESLFECRASQGEWDQARALLGEMADQYPETQGVGERHLTLADGYFRDRRFVDALDSYADFLEASHPEDPRTLRVRYQMAVSRERLGQREAAASAFEALGQESFRHQSESLLKAGVLRLELGTPELALTTLERRLALTLDPGQEALTRAYLADAYQRMDEPAASRTEWEKVAHAPVGVSDSLRAIASLHLGRLAFGEREWEAAYQGFAVAESLGLPTRIYRTGYWAGEAAYRSGDTLGAVTRLEGFLAGPDEEPLWEATARIRLAECYEGLARPSDARSQYEKVLELPLENRGLQDEARRRLIQLGALPPPPTREEEPQ